MRDGDVAGGEEMFASFMRSCELTPHATALVDRQGQWTYAEVFGACSQLATCLACRGMEQGQLVAVVGDRCATLVLALVGVSMAGGRFIVFESAQSRENSLGALRPLAPCLWLIVEDAERSDEQPRERMMGLEPSQTIALPRDRSGLMQRLAQLMHGLPPSSIQIPRRVGGNAPAYVISTSGTTGAPRFVCTRHDAVVNFLTWYRQCFSLSSTDRFTLLSGLRHDPLIRDIFAPLSMGASLHVPTDAQRMDADALAAWLVASEVSVIHLTPIMMSVLAQSPRAVSIPSVRLVGCGGDRLTTRHVAQARAVFPNAEIVNFYGATETPQVIAFHRVSARDMEHSAEQGADRGIAIGRAVPGWQLLILRDDLHQPCSSGEVGQLYASSPYLVDGYLNSPETTQQRFLANPFSTDPAARMFRTGDLGVRDADGLVWVMGRCDRQVKILANRVELDDVEAEIARYPSVSQAAVVFDSQQQQISAYICLARGATFSELGLRQHLARLLPVHAMPSKIVVVDALPMTSNGKISYAALQEQARAAVPGLGTPLQESLARIWKEELGLQQVGRNDAFFELGGSSVAALRMAARIREMLGAEVRAVDLFVYPTIALLAAFLDRSGPAADFSAGTSQLEARDRAILRARDARNRSHG